MSYFHGTHKYESKLWYGRKGKATKAAAPPGSVMLIFFLFTHMSSWILFFKTRCLAKVVFCIVQLASVWCLSVFNWLWCKEPIMVVYNAGFMWKLNKWLLQVQGMFLVMFWNQCLLLNHFSRCESYASKEQQRKRILFWSANIYGISLWFVCTESVKCVNCCVVETDLSSCLACWQQSLIPRQSLCVVRYLCR